MLYSVFVYYNKHTKLSLICYHDQEKERLLTLVVGHSKSQKFRGTLDSLPINSGIIYYK